MKKLIYLYNSRMPIAHAHGFQVMQMAEAFVQNGLEVEVVAPMRVNPIKEDAFTYYNIPKTFSVEKLPCLDLIFLNDGNPFFWLQTITFLISSWFYLHVKKYDILYTREQMVGLFFKNFILEIHSLPKKIKPFHKRIWEKASHLVVLTSFIKEKMVSEGIDTNKILVSGDGVKIENFNISLTKEEAREKLGLPKEKRLIGYIGAFRTMGMEKGLDVAIEAIKGLKISDFALVLVGGHEADILHYRGMADSLGIGDKVTLIGRVKFDTIGMYMRAFDVLIAPFPVNDHYSYYMSPMKIFEYMAAGKPIVTTDLPSLREIFTDGEALLVSPGSSEDLKKGLEKILNNPDYAKLIGDKAFLKAKELTWKNRAGKILEFIK